MEGIVTFVIGDQSDIKTFSSNKFIELGSQTKMTGYFCSILFGFFLLGFFPLDFSFRTSQGFYSSMKWFVYVLV